MSAPTLTRQSARRFRLEFFRRAAFWIPIIAIALGVVVALSVIQVRERVAATPLDPNSPTPEGSLALVRVLERQGVQVQSADTFADAVGNAGSTSTMLVYDPAELLDPGRWEELRRRSDLLVIVDPRQSQLDALGPGIERAPGPPTDSTAPPGCTLPAARRAGLVGTSGSTYRVQAAARPRERCYSDGEDGYSLIETRTGETTVVVLGASEILANGTIAQHGNAALALGILGSRPQLVWYTPGFSDVRDTGPVDAGTLSPEWVVPVIGLGLAAFLAAALWRGRRMGPLVAETLPVVVRSTETMEGRARLYERGGARLRALDSIRIGALARIAKMLGLPRASSVEEVTRASAALLGWPYERVLAVLLTREPSDEAELSVLVSEVDDLETRIAAFVRDPGAPGWTEAP